MQPLKTKQKRKLRSDAMRAAVFVLLAAAPAPAFSYEYKYRPGGTAVDVDMTLLGEEKAPQEPLRLTPIEPADDLPLIISSENAPPAAALPTPTVQKRLTQPYFTAPPVKPVEVAPVKAPVAAAPPQNAAISDSGAAAPPLPQRRPEMPTETPVAPVPTPEIAQDITEPDITGIVEPPSPAPAAPKSAVPSMSDLSVPFAAQSSQLSPEAVMKLDNLVEQLADMPDMRLQLRAYASGDEGQSGARRMSLSRGLMVRSHLIDKGIKPTRLDVRALGAETDTAPVDRVDVVFVR